MIDKLIKDGESLEGEVQVSMGAIKYFKSVKFETWVSEAMIYLEKNQPKSVLTEKMKDRFKSLNSNTNYAFYMSLLGALKALRAFDDKN